MLSKYIYEVQSITSINFKHKNKGIISWVVLKRIDDMNLQLINKKIEFLNYFMCFAVIKMRKKKKNTITMRIILIGPAIDG